MTAFQNWRTETADNVRLSGSTVHVWHAALDDADREKDFTSCLSSAERDRAQKLRFEEHRCRYVAFHGVARMILGGYLEVRPDEVRFELGPYGKPDVAADQNPGGLSFNMSESQGHALYGITREHAIGVDIEGIRDINSMETIIANTFTPTEQASFRGLSADKKRDMFFACWTRKEAFAKAVGRGLSLPLSSFDVALGQDTPARLPRLDESVGDAARWTIHPLTPAGGFVGAVAVESTAVSLHYYVWSPA